MVFHAGRGKSALAATLASLRAQGYPVSGVDVIRPGDVMPISSAPFTAVLQAGEVLAWHALPFLLRAMAGPDLVDAVFADEDCISADDSRSDPSFRPLPGA